MVKAKIFKLAENKWISVNDSLPKAAEPYGSEPLRMCLLKLAYKQGEFGHCVGYFVKFPVSGKKRWITEYKPFTHNDGEENIVTHWQYIEDNEQL